MNIIQVQDRLKGLSEQQLAQEMQMPTGMAPQFLVLSELQRRKRVRDEYQSQSAQGPQTTVAQDAVAAAGVPQAGLAPMATAMAPQTDITQNTGIASLPTAPTAAPEEPQRMAGGGMVRKMAAGRTAIAYGPEVTSDNALIAMANRQGMSVVEFLNSIDPQQAAGFAQSAIDRARRERFMPMEPVGEGVLFPTQEDLDRRYEEASQREPIFPNPGFSPDPPEDMRGPTAGYSPVTRPMPRPPATMDYRSQAIADATARGGRSGMIDAAIASGTRINPSYLLPPDPSAGNPDYSPNERMVRAGLEDMILPGPAAATELNRPPFRQPVDGGAGFATGLRDAALAGPQYAPAFEKTGRGPSEAIAARNELLGGLVDRYNAQEYDRVPGDQHPPLPEPKGIVAPQYAEDTVFDPMTGVPISGGGVVGEEPDPNSTGNWWYDYTMTDEAKKDYNETVKKVEAANAAAHGDTTAPSTDTPRPRPRPETTDPAAAISDAGGAGSGSGSGGAGGAGGMTSYEQAIADALARADKRANQDKWLSLAQAGMALMSSKEPTLAGALGEAGIAGLGAYRTSRDEAEKTKMDLMGTQFEIDLARQKLAASRAGGGGGGGFTYNQFATRLGDYAKMLSDDLATMVDGMGRPIPARKEDYERALAELQQVREQQRAMLGIPVIAGAGTEEEIEDVPQP